MAAAGNMSRMREGETGIGPQQIGVLLLFIVTVVMNGLAVALPINGQTTEALSNKYDTLFTPAGYVFSIWSVIYLLLAAYVVYQLRPAARDHARLTAIAPWFMLSSVANSLWILAWHYEILPLSLLLMLLLWGSLVMIYRRLSASRGERSTVEKIVLDLPFSIYLGWITVATVANVSALLVSLDWNGAGIGEPLWAALMIVVAGTVGIGVTIAARDLPYALVLVWAFAGIYARQQGSESLVATTAVVMALAVLGAALYGRFGRSEPAAAI